MTCAHWYQHCNCIFVLSFTQYARTHISCFHGSWHSDSTVTGHVASRTSVVYYVLALVIVISLAFIVFGGIKRVTRFTDKMVPVMAIGYTLMVLFLIAVNFNRIPDFFVAVFKGAFTPDAIFGGMFGVALIQGIKRGLLSNEAGMGTTSMAAASADTKHPCEQGFVQALSVFLDTFIICSMTGFVITMGAIWENPIYDWSTIKSSIIDVFAQSIAVLMPGTAFDEFSIIFGCMAYAGMFMDRIDRGEQRPPSVMLVATRLLYHMGNIFRDNAPAMPTVGGIQIDRKRLAQLRQKRVALGHKSDDYEFEPQGYTMQFH